MCQSLACFVAMFDHRINLTHTGDSSSKSKRSKPKYRSHRVLFWSQSQPLLRNLLPFLSLWGKSRGVRSNGNGQSSSWDSSLAKKEDVPVPCHICFFLKHGSQTIIDYGFPIDSDTSWMILGFPILRSQSNGFDWMLLILRLAWLSAGSTVTYTAVCMNPNSKPDWVTHHFKYWTYCKPSSNLTW